MTALVFSKFTQQGIENFGDSPRRIKSLADEWKRDGVDIKSAHYIVEGGEYDTVLRVETLEVTSLYAVVKRMCNDAPVAQW